MTFEINCAIPGKRPYSETLDLPLAMSILSSYFQEVIPRGSLFVGEIDLFQNIRPLANAQLNALGERFGGENLSGNTKQITKIFIAKKNEEVLQDILSDKDILVKVVGVENLQQLVELVWPDIVERSDTS